jgi:hypothetical protein
MSSLSQLALQIPKEFRLAAARAALLPHPDHWKDGHPTFAERQADDMAEGRWGIELSDHACNCTLRMMRILCAMGWRNNMMSYEIPHPF